MSLKGRGRGSLCGGIKGGGNCCHKLVEGFSWGISFIARLVFLPFPGEIFSELETLELWILRPMFDLLFSLISRFIYNLL